MDLEINTSMSNIVKILKNLGFNPVDIKGNGVLEAKLKTGFGRFHVLGVEVNGWVYLDVHHDLPIHLMFIGVDYSKKPEKICKEILAEAAKQNIEAKITGGTSWFNRKNKAIIKGIKIKK